MNQKKSAGIKSFFTPNSLRSQLLFRSLLILAVLLVLIGLLQYVFMQEVIYRNKAASLQSQIMSIPRFVWEYPGISPENDPVRPPRFFIPEAGLAFIDVEGNYFVLSNGPGSIKPPRLDTQEYLDILKKKPEHELPRNDGAEENGTGSTEPPRLDRPEHVDVWKKKPGPHYKIIDAGGAEQLLVLQPVFDHGQALGVVQVSTLTSPLKELLIRQLLTFLFLSLIAMLIGLLGFSPIIKRTLVPLFNMVDIAEQIDAGNLTKRFPTRQGQMEIDRLAESFNGMLERLEASFAAERETKEQMRRFIADASHELRTPLTSIHGFLEVLLRGAANQPDQLYKALTSMYGESERLNKLVHDLLLLAKLDRTPRLELTEGLLDAVIREMEPQLRLLAGNRRLDLRIEPNMKCKYDADKMKQVILNLFHNAVQHTDPEKGHIRISLSKKKSGVALSVQDNGPGISESHLPRVFDRFYRIDTSRTRRYGGAGLGLSITKSIVDAHGGTISVESKEGEGCTFHVWLPA
ncbi:sensor histidine kinase [Desulforamulus putei]|uniref:histidine kinase n=1 Tax=Desulforamulus putei DSM 12395 TaxID=1121429 RepID=A0A1M4WBK5_9FIRM|nr:HAMP domain-containing sensor histidine kinase [Desulforamulus putei]SHE78545.1 two-component system, OmpR family, sensor kinase [Desulforamulus putei DSM 12395]